MDPQEYEKEEYIDEEELLEYMSDDGGDQGEEDELALEVARARRDVENARSVVARCSDRVVVVQDLPIANTEKAGLLRKRIGEIFAQVGELDNEATATTAGAGEQDPGLCVFLPMDTGKGESLGFAFIPFKTAESAALAVAKVNGLQFGKQKIRVSPYSDLDKYAHWPDKFSAPALAEYKKAEMLEEWLLDHAGRDQYVIRHDVSTEVNWCEGIAMGGESTLAYAGERETANGKIWCEMYVAWSPLGSYLVTFHLQGVALWGTNEFIKLKRLPHHGVERISFSPCERFLITWDGKDTGNDPKSLIVWDVKTGANLRSFNVPRKSEWPIMRWSYDGEFFARTTENGICVFETKTMRMVDGKPLVAKGVVQFEWSPSERLIAYWSAEDGNIPARVIVTNPTKHGESDLRSKNLVNVSSIRLHWHSDGDFLCAQVLRHTKTKKTTFTNLEIFRMRASGIPTETLNLSETLIKFNFEPSGTKFGLITGEEGRTTVAFYELGKSKSNSSLALIENLPNKQFTSMHWSPAGQHLILANFASNTGQLEFWDMSEKKCLRSENHFMCNEIHWDPSGRIVATCVVQPMFGAVSLKYTMENGYKFWSFQGDKLCETPKKKFHQFIWRPRPKNIIGEEEKAAIQANLSKYLKKYEKEDDIKLKRKELAQNREKIHLLSDFRSFMKGMREQFANDEKRREAAGLPSILASEADNTATDEVEMIIEEYISEVREVL